LSTSRRCMASMGVAVAAVVSGFGGSAVFAGSDLAEGLQFGAGPDFVKDVREVVVSGGFAFIASGYSGLVVVDVREQSEPVEAGRVDTPGFAGGVDLRGRLVLVADGYHGLRVIDIERPTEPVEIGSVAVKGWTADVAVLGEIVLVAAGAAGLVVVDFSGALNPVEIASMEIGGSARRVTVLDSWACVTDDRGRVHVIDLSDPILPVEIEVLEPPEPCDGAPSISAHECVAELMTARDQPSLTWMDAMVFGD
jgi:hypothetical protein